MSSLKELRELNRQRLLEALHEAGPADRAELVHRTGLSRATVSALVAEGLERGVVVEDGRLDGGERGGRRSALLRLDPSAGTALGVHFGHGHVRVALADLGASVRAQRRRELDVDAGPAEALDAAAELVSAVLSEARIRSDRVIGVGMGLPGPIDHRTGMVVGSSLVLANWRGFRPAEELAQRLGLPVRLDNEANLGALGEFLHGAGRDATDMAYVGISAGVGAGLVLDGRLQTGSCGVAGEIGHIVMVPKGALCRCGNRGCLETVASSGALAQQLEAVHGGDLPTQRLLDLAALGDEDVIGALTTAGAYVGRALAALAMTLNPDVIVVGGELGAASEALLDAIRTELRRSSLPGAGNVPVRAAVLGEHAEALGAVALALSERDWLRRSGLVALRRPRKSQISAAGHQAGSGVRTTEHLRERNTATLVNALRHHGRLSRAGLAHAAGLSRTTVVTIVDELDRRGLIVETADENADGPRGRGRPATQIRLHPSAGVALGIFIGREGMRVALTDLSLTVLSRGRTRFALDSPGETLLELAMQLGDAALDDAGVPRGDLIGVGIGVPSPVDPETGAIDPGILANWAGVSIRDKLSRRFATDVVIENEANVQALAELAMGAARGLGDVIYVTVSWGIGGAVIVNGQLIRGASGLAGEFGHVRVRDDGPLCGCGRRGCVGSFASGRAMLATLRHLHGADLDLDDMLELALAGDTGVRRVLADGGREIGAVIAAQCNVLDPEAVIVGGELSVDGSPLLDGIREALGRALVAAGPPPIVLPAALRELSGPLGAATVIVRSSSSTAADQ